MTNDHIVQINGHPLYYEEYGEGHPLLLLHGGCCNLHNSFDRQIPLFSESHRVIGIEQVGHGHTPDIPRPISYQAMTEDTASLLRQLDIANADVMGWSDGGILGLMLASRHPDLVHRMVVSGVNIRYADFDSEIARYLSETPPEKFFPDLREDYAQVSPDGDDHWPVVVAKLRDMWIMPVYMEIAELTKIAAPTLIVSGDRDIISAEVTLEIFRAIPQAKLCFLPGTGHHTFRDAAGLFNSIIQTFLNAA